jgi:tRNA modification GTPase
MNTIFALSSGRGKAGVSVVRISGPEATKALFAFGIKNLPKPRIATFAKLKNKGDIIDQALVLYFNAPHSFSGEDIVELHLHGSVAVVTEVVNVLSKIKNFRLAEPGEFSKRAFENNKMDLVQAEGLADLIESETSAQAKQAMRAMEGESSKIYDDWRKRVIEIMAFVEAYIDFPDENIPADLDLQAQNKVKKIIDEINNQIANDNGERVRLGAVATIIGEPNVGKSTLINFLSKRDVAIVSDIAGTTRDSIEVHLNIDGMPLTIIDTAGIRESSDAIEREGVKRALEKADKADFRIIMLEAGKSENESINRLIDQNSIVVVNKIDLHKKSADKNYIQVSLKENIGTDELVKNIKEKVEKLLGNSENAIITRSRHKHELQNTVSELNNFIKNRNENMPIELCSETLRRASFYLGKIVGKIGVEDILDKIFSEFCIGK